MKLHYLIIIGAILCGTLAFEISIFHNLEFIMGLITGGVIGFITACLVSVNDDDERSDKQ